MGAAPLIRSKKAAARHSQRSAAFYCLPMPAGNDALQTGDFLSKNSCHAPPPDHFGRTKETVHHLQTCTSQALKIYANLSVP